MTSIAGTGPRADRTGPDRSASVRDAVSDSWSVRAAAGQRLAADAEVPEVGVVLGRLLLDAHDTFVTFKTAEALLLRGDVPGLRLVLAALAAASAQTGDQLQSAILNVCEQSQEDVEHLAELAAALVSDPDAGVREEARGLLGPGR